MEVLTRVLFQVIECTIAAGTVDDNDFIRTELLRAYGSDGTLQGFHPVVAKNHHGIQRRCLFD